MDKYCDTCKDLEASHYDKTEFYVSLLEQQNKLWAEGKAIEARAVDSVISKAGQARAEAQKQLLMHRASHRANESHPR
jgi:DNA-binding MarR family transcriptional regulator